MYNSSFQSDEEIDMNAMRKKDADEPDSKMAAVLGATASESKMAVATTTKDEQTFSEKLREACRSIRMWPTYAWTFLLASKAEPIMALSCLGFYMPMPFIQNLMIEKVCLRNFPREVCMNATMNETIESINQDTVGQYLLYHYLVRQLPAVILSLLMGTWSDVYGRRYVIIITIVGNIASFIFYILNSIYDWPPEAIILSGIPAGITGDYAGFMLGLFGFVKDVHPMAALSLRISLADGTEMLASQVGPLIGSKLYEAHGYGAVFGLCIGFLCLNIVACCLLIHDNGFKEAPVKQKVYEFFQPKGISESVKSVFKKRPQNKRAYIFAVLVTVMIVFFGFFGHSEISYLYARLKIKWTVIEYSNYNALIGGCSTIGLIIVLPVLLYVIKLNDVTMGLVGHLGFIGFYIGTAVANTSESMYAVCAFQIIAVMAFVTLRSCISKCVDSNEIGRVMSIYAVLQALFRNLGQTLATQIYLATKDTYMGAFFILCGSLFAICIVTYIWMYFNMKKNKFDLNEQSEHGIQAYPAITDHFDFIGPHY